MKNRWMNSKMSPSDAKSQSSEMIINTRTFQLQEHIFQHLMFLKQNYDQHTHSKRVFFFSHENFLLQRCVFQLMLFGVKK